MSPIVDVIAVVDNIVDHYVPYRPIASPILTAEWVSPAWIARYYKRSTRIIEKWCKNGTLIDFGFSVYKDNRNRWWIKCPENIPTLELIES